MDSSSKEEAISIDDVSSNHTPAITSASPRSPTSKPSPKRTLTDVEPATHSSIPSSPMITPATVVDNDSTAVTTPAATSSATLDSSPNIEPGQKKTTTTTSLHSLSTTTQDTKPNPKIVLLHHDTVIDGRHIITRTIQNCFTAILGPTVLPPSEATILNAFAQNATLAGALVQLGAFKTSGKSTSSTSSPAGSNANSDSTESTPKSKDKGKGKAKATTASPSIPASPTEEDKKQAYQDAIATWTQAYLHYTHEFLSEFDVYSDLEPFVKAMRQQGTKVAILIAQDGFEPQACPEQTQTGNKDGDGNKDGKKKAKTPELPKGVTIVQELMRRMGVTAAGRGSRGYQGFGRQQANGGATVVVNGIYASGIDGDGLAKVWKGQILPALEGKAAGRGTDTEMGTKAATDTPAMQKEEVIFACSSTQYLALARAIGATACWVARCEDKGKSKGKVTEQQQQADLVVEDLEKLGRLIGSEMEPKGKRGEDGAVVEASHSSSKQSDAGTSTKDAKNDTPKLEGNATVETEDIDMPDADHSVVASIEIPGADNHVEAAAQPELGRNLPSPKAMKAIKTEDDEDNNTAATVITVAQKQSPKTGKKRAREQDDSDDFMPVEMALEKKVEDVPVVDLTDE